MLNRIFNNIMFGLIFILFSQFAFSLLISEVMFDPLSDENYNEWIEIYNENNSSINVSLIKICNMSIKEGYFDNNTQNITSKNGFIIDPYEFFIITDGGSGSLVKENFEIDNKTKIFHTESSSICSGLSNIGKEIILNYDNSSVIYNYTNQSNSEENYGSYYDFNFSEYRNGCVNGGTPGKYIICNETEENKEINFEIQYSFSISNDTLQKDQKLYFYGNITNTNEEITANLTIKIGIKQNDGNYEYPKNMILFDSEIILKKGINTLEKIIGNLSWKSTEYLISGEYKAYSRLVTKYEEKRPYKTFFLYNKANIFLEEFESLNEIIMLNETTLFSFNISNEENEKYNISYGFRIKDFKTVNEGEYDYENWCNTTEIENKTEIKILCVWNPGQNFIAENVTYTIYPKIKFEYENTTIIKEGKRITQIFNGLKDLGEPKLIIEKVKRASFGKFSNIIVEYESKNYGNKIKIITYGYPKQIISDYEFNGIKANDYDNPLHIEIETVRDKNYIISLPIIVKSNCDNYYSNDKYRIRIRIFKELNGDWIETLTEDTNIEIDGRNENLCPKKSIVTPSTNIELSSIQPSGEKNYFTYGDVKFYIETPKKINSNNFKINLNISNTQNETKEFQIISYLYSGNKKYSEEKTEKIILESNKTEEIILENIINKKIENNKEYKIMIKLNSTERKTIKTYSKDTEIEIQENNEIKSFYTLQKKYAKFVKLYATTNDNLGEFELISEFGTQRKTIEKINTTKMFFEEKLKPGINTYFLLLKNNNRTQDVKKLLIFANETEIRIIDEIKEKVDVGLELFANTEENFKENLINSNAIKTITYDFTENRKKLINYLLLTISIMGISSYLWRRYS